MLAKWVHLWKSKKTNKPMCNTSQESSIPIERQVVVLAGQGHPGNFWRASHVWCLDLSGGYQVALITWSFTALWFTVCVCNHCCCLVAKLGLTLCNPMNCSPPGSTVNGISQEETLEWVAISFSRGSSWLRGQTHVSYTGRQTATEAPGKPPCTTIYFN